MEPQHPKDKVGTGWILAIIALLVLLVVGVVLYARLAAPLEEPKTGLNNIGSLNAKSIILLAETPLMPEGAYTSFL